MLTLQQQPSQASTPPPPATHQETTRQWRAILTACDDLTRQGHCGPDLQRLASELDLPMRALLDHSLAQCVAVQRYTERCVEALRECQYLYQRLYIDAYNVLDRTQQCPVVNDGEARHAVSLDPEGPFNHIQCGAEPVWLTLASDNETLYKYAGYSTLATMPGVRQKVDALWCQYDEATEAMLAEKLAQPLDTLQTCHEQLDAVMQQLDVLLQVLNSLYAEARRDTVLALYSQCVALKRQLRRLLKRADTQTRNTEKWRDNVLVRLAEASRLLQNVTRPYEQTQSHRSTNGSHTQFSIF